MPKKSRKRDSDDEYETTKPSKVFCSRYKHREPMDLNLMIEHDEVEADKKNLPCWKHAHATGSPKPPRHLCIICGFFADYKCRNCASRRIEGIDSYYCSLRCLEVHKEANCGKVLHLTHW